MTYPYDARLCSSRPERCWLHAPLRLFAPDLSPCRGLCLSPLVMAAELVIAAVFGISFATFPATDSCAEPDRTLSGS